MTILSGLLIVYTAAIVPIQVRRRGEERGGGICMEEEGRREGA